MTSRQLPRLLSGALTGLALGALAAAALLEAAVRATPLPDLSRVASQSRLVTDRAGEPLWLFLAADDRLRFAADPAAVDPEYRAMLLAYEDKRFLSHSGVDPLAAARAIWQAARFGRIVSGASTITMQTVRLLDPQPRTLAAKLDEMLRAVRLERELSKEQVLALYLTLAPYGGNVEGIRAATLAYFGKEPRDLSREEAATLVALPRSPEALRPDRHLEAAAAAAAEVLARAGEDGPRPAPARIALHPPLPLAPHLALRVARRGGVPDTLRTTIDARLQRRVKALAGDAVSSADPGVSIAIVVIRLADSSLAAYVGGADFHDDRRAGQVDLAEALRSPGSALKPFIYGMAFESLIIHPDTIVDDAPVRFGDYQPENFDGGFAGEMTVREALVRSVNTTAVSILRAVGPARLMARLRSVGAPLVTENSDDEAGLAVALGGGGISLTALTNLYAGLGRHGTVQPLRELVADPPGKPLSLLSREAAAAVADILADTPPPPGIARRQARDGGRRIAFKTGTSYGFRDAWAVGFDSDHAVGVWIGRPDGAPHLGSYGITAAAPAMMRVFDVLPAPARAIDAGSTPSALAAGRDLPPRLRRFVEATDATTGVSILFPQDGAVVSLGDDAAADGLHVAAFGGAPPYQWFLDGDLIGTGTAPSTRWSPESGGQYEITVVDATGRAARSSFWLEPFATDH